MKPVFAFDTAALISLGHTDLIRSIVDHYSICITNHILEEIQDIAKRNDEDADAAKQWLKYTTRFVLQKTTRKNAAEDELFLICQKEDIPLVTDDIQAIKRFEDHIVCLFSVHIVYLLYKKKVITKRKALLAIEKMRTHRDWKQNLIALTAQTLFE